MAKILQVFNRYLQLGGEANSVISINHHLSQGHEVDFCYFDSQEWTGPDAPTKIGQVFRMFYNRKSRDILEQRCREFQPDVLLFHNIYPVGSPSLYHVAHKLKIPVIQFVHNFRPFSVGGTLYAKGQFLTQSLEGNFWPEVWHATWQNSRLKTAIFALVIKFLHRTEWLESVKAWVCVSDFMRQKFRQAGVPKEQLFTLRHSWDALEQVPENTDDGYYLFLSRLIPEKGVHTLLKAWEKIEERMGEATPHLYIGGEGILQGSVEQAATKSGKIKYLGLVSKDIKADALAHCRAVVVPSIWWEPLGLVTYEGYDYAKPVLAAASGGLTETLVDGITGYLHQPDNVESLLDSVLKIEQMSVEQRQQMGLAGRQWLLKNTRVDDWKRQFNTIIETTMMNK